MTLGSSSSTDSGTQIKRINMLIGHFKAQITRANKYAREQEQQVLLDLEGLRIRIEELQKGLQAYKANILELLLLTDGEFSEEDEIEERCLNVIADLRTAIRLAESSAKSMKSEEQLAENSTCSTKLPQLDIVKFNGTDITQYTSFIDIFTAVVGTNKTLTPVQKLFYLKKYLEGDALLLINGLPLINESYSQALELLKNRYDNKCLLITHHVNLLLDCQPISKGNSSELRHLVSLARQHLGSLKNFGQQTQYWDMLVIPILLRKLDGFSCRAYHSDRDTTKLPTLEDFLNYLERRAISFEESQAGTGKSTSKFNHTKSTNLANVSSNKVGICKYCQDTSHKIFTCKKFQGLSAKERIEFVTLHNLCKICLNAHDNKCYFHFKCSICRSKEHNSLLHCEETVCNIASSVNYSVSKGMILLPTIKVKFAKKDGSYIIARGLVDSGSQLSFIKTDLINQLKVSTFDYNINIITALSQTKKPITKAVNLSMQSMHDGYSCNALFSVVDKITAYLPQCEFQIPNITIPKSVQLADNMFNIPGEISFLVAADVFFKILLPHKIELSRDKLVLLATKFGYIISGNIKQSNDCLLSQTVSNESVLLHAINDNKVDSLIQKFWDEQHIPEIINKGTANQDVCEREFKKSVQLNNNRFQVSLPLKVPIEEIMLGDSFNIALQRLNFLCKKFTKNPELKNKYIKFINDYVDLGHASKFDLFKLEKPFEHCYFLPHHAVLKDSSVTTKLRAVFDASARTNLNISLNDILHAGPVVQKELFDILIQFRTYKYVVMTDVKQMYRQISIDPAQTHLQLILWKENLDDPLLCLQLKTVTYGVTSSSFLATRCLVELAQRYEEQYPLAASVLLNNTYIDDCLFGSSSIDGCKTVLNELTKLTKLGSFELHKWCASYPEILTEIPTNQQYFQGKDLNNVELTVKALGLSLNITSDEFIISKPCGRLPNVWTKRSVLSFIGTFFDPLGLAGPIVTRAKEFLQKVWLQNLNWDIPLTDQLLHPWRLFFHDLISMKPIYIKRNLMLTDANYIQLIGYCDASNIAYGACIYLRTVQNNTVSVKLLCSKSRIAPLKSKPTIPRLELNGCVLLARLYTKICSIMVNYPLKNRILYTDSQIALCWLSNPPIKDNYIKNRVILVNELTKDCIWSHVAGASNPADCLSRGLMPSELSSKLLWWQGPSELQNVDFSVHPFSPKEIMCNVNSDHVAQQVNYSVTEEVLPISKYSSLLKLQRIVCFVLRFVKNCKIKKDKRNVSKQLNLNEYNLSMESLIKYVQTLHCLEEIECIKGNKIDKSNLKKLYPFLDSQGLLRVGGRLENASIPFNQKHPIILPKNCNFTTLVIRQEHSALLHAGLKLTLSSLSQQYYIIGATTLVKRIINKCILCYKFRAQNAQQLMSSLPYDRVNPDRPFNKVGMDYCGPFDIKQSTVRRSIVSKGYVCIFVCFVTKCVHLELVSDLTTDSFLAAFKRFHSRRGLPHTVYCDNASTFKGANNNLRQLYTLCKNQAHQSAVIDYCNMKKVDFKFIPSYSPTWGGLWEAAVKSAKYHFKRVIGKLILTYEQFNTVIVQVEGVLNSRPITPLSSDSSDFTFLTPGHFLINQPLTATPEPVITTDVNALHFWKKCTKV